MRRPIKKHLTMVPAVQWHDGMLLSPHHFQQQEIRNEQKIAHHTRLLPYRHFGLCSVQFDPVLLSDGKVRIQSLEAVMPDSLIVVYQDGPDLPPLELILDKNVKETLVHLCLAASNFIDGSTVAGDFPRYHSLTRNAIDMNTGDNPIDIPVLVPRLFLYPSVPPWATGFPLIKMRYHDGRFTQVPFTGPCFFLWEDSDLWKQCAALAGRIREKTTYYTERYQTTYGTALFVETGIILKTLLSAMLPYEALLHGPATHPAVVYQTLVQTLSHLAGLKPAQIPPVLSGYMHNDIDHCFEDALSLAHSYLDTLDCLYSIVRFQKKERLFSVLLQQDPGPKFYVGLKSQRTMTYVDTEKWMHDAVICSDFAVEVTRIQRITGAHRSLLREENMRDMLPSQDILIFEIKNDPAFIKTGQHLHIFNPSDHDDFRPLEIFHYIPHMSRPS